MTPFFIMSDYVRFRKKKKDELMHYGVKGMKWHKHKKYADFTRTETKFPGIDWTTQHSNIKPIKGLKLATGRNASHTGGIEVNVKDVNKSKIYSTRTYLNPHVPKGDKDPRWAINQAYKPKATKKAKLANSVKCKTYNASYKVKSFISKILNRNKKK